MRTSILTSAATLLAAAQAGITGFYAPPVVAPGQTYEILLSTDIQVQYIQEIAMAFGIVGQNVGTLGGLGILIETKVLGREFSYATNNITHTITVPKEMPLGLAFLQGAHFGLVNDTSSPETRVYYTNVTVVSEVNGEPAYTYSRRVPATGGN